VSVGADRAESVRDAFAWLDAEIEVAREAEGDAGASTVLLRYVRHHMDGRVREALAEAEARGRAISEAGRWRSLFNDAEELAAVRGVELEKARAELCEYEDAISDAIEVLGGHTQIWNGETEDNNEDVIALRDRLARLMRRGAR
jgi:hypothetical protein